MLAPAIKVISSEDDEWINEYLRQVWIDWSILRGWMDKWMDKEIND